MGMTAKMLLLLTDRADAVAKWTRDLNQWETSVVIKTNNSGLPDDPDETFALVMVDLDGAAISQAGLDLCRRLRMQMGSPILLLTNDRDETNLLQAYEVGIDAHIAKPITVELLLAQVNSWLYWTPKARYPKTVLALLDMRSPHRLGRRMAGMRRRWPAGVSSMSS
jgi:DNA-binding response OmpR family regulator